MDWGSGGLGKGTGGGTGIIQEVHRVGQVGGACTVG